MTESEHTFSALSMRFLTTANFAKMGWQDFEIQIPVHVSGLSVYRYTNVISPLGSGNVSKKEIAPSLFGCSMVIYIEYFEEFGSWSQAPHSNQGMEEIHGWCLQHCPKRKSGGAPQIPKFHWSTHKIQPAILCLSSLLSRFEWVLQEDLQIHACTGLFQWGETPSSCCWCIPKTRSPLNKREDVVYHWECQADGCNSPHMWEKHPGPSGRGSWKNSKSNTSAILKHCMDHHHLLPSINNFAIIDKDHSQVTQEAKEAIHIRRLDPSLNQNIVKMSIPHCFDPLIRAKPKHPCVGVLSQSMTPVDEIAPPSQIPGLNLTQFYNIGTFRPNQVQFIAKHSTRACRARNLFN